MYNSVPRSEPNEPIYRCESTLRLLQEELRKARASLPVEAGRLADAAGEEKSAKPPMRSELPPGLTDTHTCIHAKSKGLVHHIPKF